VNTLFHSVDVTEIAECWRKWMTYFYPLHFTRWQDGFETICKIRCLVLVVPVSTLWLPFILV